MSAIPSSLEALAVPIDDLAPFPGNPRRGDVDLIVASLERHGQYRPLVVNRRTGHVLAGNHTLLAARALGWDRVAVTYVDVDDATAAAIVLVDNRANDRAMYDDEDLASLLASLDALDATGWEQHDLDELLRSLDDAAASLDEDDEPATKAPPTFGVYDPALIVEAAFEHYRRVGFPYRAVPLHVAMTEINVLAGLHDAQLARSRIAHHVADTYHPHRWHAHIEGAPNALDVFESDDKLRVALGHIVAYAYSWSAAVNVFGLTHGAQAASNFRPGVALSLMRRFAPDGGTVLDTSTGYGGRLVAFLASSCSTYIGVDPSVQTHEGNVRLTRDLCPDSKTVDLLNLPAEDVPHERVAGLADVAITSPPYFRKEHYSDEPTQSWKRYETGEAWRDGFLRPMLALQHAGLKSRGVSVVNIADVELRGTRGVVPLVDWTIACAADVGFEVEAVEQLTLMRRWGPQADTPATEPVLVLRRTT